MTEILCRSAKHYFRHYTQSVPLHLLSYSISHFLNCFLTILTSPSSDFLSDELTSSSTSASVNNSTTNSNSSTTNSSSQKTNNKKKNKKQQQQLRKQNPLMRNGQSMNSWEKNRYESTFSYFRIVGFFIVNIESSLVAFNN